MLLNIMSKSHLRLRPAVNHFGQQLAINGLVRYAIHGFAILVNTVVADKKRWMRSCYAVHKRLIRQSEVRKFITNSIHVVYLRKRRFSDLYSANRCANTFKYYNVPPSDYQNPNSGIVLLFHISC